MIFEIIVCLAFVAIVLLNNDVKHLYKVIDDLRERVDEMASVHAVAERFREIDKSIIKIAEDKVVTDSRIQSNTDKIKNINRRLSKLEEPKTNCICSSTENKYTKSEVDAKFEELYELLGIEKEDYLAEKEVSYMDRIYNTYSEICGYPTKSTKEIKQRLVFKKKSNKK
jgi:NAD-specific glutamate dehydrogenase